MTAYEEKERAGGLEVGLGAVEETKVKEEVEDIEDDANEEEDDDNKDEEQGQGNNKVDNNNRISRHQ